MAKSKDRERKYCHSFLRPLTRAFCLAIGISVFLSSTGVAQPPGGPFVDLRNVGAGVFDAPAAAIFTNAKVKIPPIHPRDMWRYQIVDLIDIAQPSCPTVCGPPGGTGPLGFMYVGDSGDPDYMVLTTFYGIDVDPLLSDDLALMTGYNAASPELVFSNERIVGLTQEYPADFLGTFTVGSLGSLSASQGFDFTRVVGDPNSIVYAFQATVPFDDFAIIPEPSSVLLIGIGLVGICVSTDRRRRRAV